MRQQANRNQPRQLRSGLSLVEVVVSTLLVGLVVVTSMKTVGGVIRTWQVAEQQHDGMALAQELMTEVQQARYIEPDDAETFGREGSESAVSRALWDDTDDYDDWNQSPPQAKDGTVLTEFNGWTRSVNVQKVLPDVPSSPYPNSWADSGMRRITVTVTAPDSTQTELVALRSASGVMEQLPDVESTFVTHVDIDLQVGASATAVRSGANITNHAEDQ